MCLLFVWLARQGIQSFKYPSYSPYKKRIGANDNHLIEISQETESDQVKKVCLIT